MAAAPPGSTPARAGASTPSGIPFILANEAAERFNFYGLQAILVVYMTDFLVNRAGTADRMTDTEAKYYFHLFNSAVYFLPLLGGLLADAFWGKYRTIFWLSWVYTAGGWLLATDTTRLGLAVGLALIALGSGGIKPCVSAMVGDQFDQANPAGMSRVYGWFYFAINAGSAVSMLLTPWLLERYGPHVAFGVPGLSMLLATVVFRLGRERFVQAPAHGLAFVRETFSAEGLRSVSQMAIVFTLVAVFWALYYQSGSAWVLQAKRLNCRWLGVEWLPSQMQAANSALLLGFIPAFTYGVYPALGRIWRLTPLRKIGLGLFVTVLSFLPPLWLEARLAQGASPSIGWQFLAYVLLTAAEVMVSITSLEFAYTQAPPRMKSSIMSLYLLSMSLGNAFDAALNRLLEAPAAAAALAGPRYYLLFVGLMLATTLVFALYARRYREWSPAPA